MPLNGFPVEGLDVEPGDATVAPRNLVELLACDDRGDIVLGSADALFDHLQHAACRWFGP
jgi:hypothetical protein